MNIGVDTNILLYAVNKDCEEHAQAKENLEKLIRDETPWCLTWGILYEFLRVCTHSNVFVRPLSTRTAMSFVGELLDCPSLYVLKPTDRHRETLQQTLRESGFPSGNMFHDVKTAVILREHGVPEILTADGDFLRFRFLKVTNPFISR